MSQKILKEGWTVEGHYFVNGMSICGAIHISGSVKFTLGNDEDPEKCHGCRREILDVKDSLRRQGVKVDILCSEGATYSQLQGLFDGLNRLKGNKAWK